MRSLLDLGAPLTPRRIKRASRGRGCDYAFNETPVGLDWDDDCADCLLV